MKPFDGCGRLQRARLKRAGAFHFCKGVSVSIILLTHSCAEAVMLPGCGSAGSPSTKPSNVVVSLQPGSASLFLGQTQQFQATVMGATDTSVRWLVNNVPQGNACTGTISAGGLYTAPADLLSAACGSVDANGLYTAPA